METGELAGTACNALTLARRGEERERRVTHPNMPPTLTKCFYQVLLGPAGLTSNLVTTSPSLLVIFCHLLMIMMMMMMMMITMMMTIN